MKSFLRDGFDLYFIWLDDWFFLMNRLTLLSRTLMLHGLLICIHWFLLQNRLSWLIENFTLSARLLDFFFLLFYLLLNLLFSGFLSLVFLANLFIDVGVLFLYCFYLSLYLFLLFQYLKELLWQLSWIPHLLYYLIHVLFLRRLHRLLHLRSHPWCLHHAWHHHLWRWKSELLHLLLIEGWRHSIRIESSIHRPGVLLHHLSVWINRIYCLLWALLLFDLPVMITGMLVTGWPHCLRLLLLFTLSMFTAASMFGWCLMLTLFLMHTCAWFFEWFLGLIFTKYVSLLDIWYWSWLLHFFCFFYLG